MVFVELVVCLAFIFALFYFQIMFRDIDLSKEERLYVHAKFEDENENVC